MKLKVSEKEMLTKRLQDEIKIHKNKKGDVDGHVKNLEDKLNEKESDI